MKKRLASSGLSSVYISSDQAYILCQECWAKRDELRSGHPTGGNGTLLDIPSIPRTGAVRAGGSSSGEVLAGIVDEL